MKKAIFITITVLLIGGGVYAYLYYRVGNTGEFVSAYKEYNSRWIVSEKSIFTPGANSNTVRQKLNAALLRVLDEKNSEKNRFALAASGLDPLLDIRSQIDVMKENVGISERDVAKLDARSHSVVGLRVRKKSEEIVLLAEKRNVTAREIETLSYKMNDSVKEIFQEISRNEGKLTDKQITSLNDQVPAAERDYERLNELYRNLTDQKQDMKKLFREFEAMER